jgi:hypothetical protein
MKRQTVSADNQEELATNQTTSVVVTGTITADQGAAGASAWPVSVSSLPSGLATSAKQDTGNTSLASVDTKLSSQATATKQDTGNTSLSSIDTKTPALGQALAASSTPVVLTAIQVAALTPPAAITNYALESGGNLASSKTDLDAIAAVSGTTAGAAVITDVNGTIQQYLRGLVKLAITAGSFLVTATLSAGSAIIGKVGIDQTTPGTTNGVQVVAALPSGTNLLGTVYDEPDDTWSQTHVPAANTKATIAQSAGGGSLKNVCTGFTVSLCAGSTAPTAIQLSVALIDGASGGSTYLWRSNISLPATAGAIVAFVVSGKKFTGTAATAMTLEFSAAGGANTFESVTMKGYTK